MDLLYALADYYVKRSKFREAKPIAEKMVASHPEVQVGHKKESKSLKERRS